MKRCIASDFFRFRMSLCAFLLQPTFPVSTFWSVGPSNYNNRRRKRGRNVDPNIAEKGPQNRTKDGNAGEDFNKDSFQCDERRRRELGHRTVEIFVLAHIFSNKIEVAYEEAVALKKQEELICEEGESWLAESEQKAKRGAAEMEKKSEKTRF